MFLGSRGFPRAPQEAQEGSQEPLKSSRTQKKTDPKITPEIVKFWSFGTILGHISGSKILKKGDPKWDPFLDQKWGPEMGGISRTPPGPAECAGVLEEFHSIFDRLGQTETDELDKRVLTRRRRPLPKSV